MLGNKKGQHNSFASLIGTLGHVYCQLLKGYSLWAVFTSDIGCFFANWSLESMPGTDILLNGDM